MSDLNSIIQVNIFRETTALASASFGLPLIASEFAIGKTTSGFDRYKLYGSLSELSDDGWGATDKVYRIAQIMFSQTPRIPRLAVGRLDSGDANITEGLNAISAVNDDWYGLIVAENTTVNGVLSAEFVADNSIVATVNGVECDPVVFSTDQSTTMGLLKAEIEGKVAGSTFTVGTTPFTTFSITAGNGGIDTVEFVVTGGASQPILTTQVVGSESDKLEVAAWAEGKVKLNGAISEDAGIIDPASTTDIASQLKNLSYLRTFLVYSPNGDYINTGIMGAMFPGTPGRATWCYEAISGVSVVNMNEGAKNASHGKNANTYTSIARTGNFEKGKVSVGEYIDIVWGLDYLKSELQIAVFSALKNSQKISYDDGGITSIVGIVKGVLKRFSTPSIPLLQEDSIVVSAPLATDISMNDKANRHLPDVVWTALLQGAIHTTTITGTVTL